MGWTKVAQLRIAGRPKLLPIVADELHDEEGAAGASLWTCGGIRGVEVHIGAQIIYLHESALELLIADEIRTRRISILEGMATEEILAKFFTL